MVTYCQSQGIDCSGTLLCSVDTVIADYTGRQYGPILDSCGSGDAKPHSHTAGKGVTSVDGTLSQTVVLLVTSGTWISGTYAFFFFCFLMDFDGRD